jgi:hypothetical protein
MGSVCFVVVSSTLGPVKWIDLRNPEFRMEGHLHDLLDEREVGSLEDVFDGSGVITIILLDNFFRFGLQLVKASTYPSIGLLSR